MYVGVEKLKLFIGTNRDSLLHLFEDELRNFKKEILSANELGHNDENTTLEMFFLALKKLRDEIKLLFLIEAQKLEIADENKKRSAKSS